MLQDRLICETSKVRLLLDDLDSTHTQYKAFAVRVFIGFCVHQGLLLSFV